MWFCNLDLWQHKHANDNFYPVLSSICHQSLLTAWWRRSMPLRVGTITKDARKGCASHLVPPPKLTSWITYNFPSKWIWDKQRKKALLHFFPSKEWNLFDFYRNSWRKEGFTVTPSTCTTEQLSSVKELLNIFSY